MRFNICLYNQAFVDATEMQVIGGHKLIIKRFCITKMNSSISIEESHFARSEQMCTAVCIQLCEAEVNLRGSLS